MERESLKHNLGRAGSRVLVAALLATTAIPVSIVIVSSDSFAQGAMQMTYNVPAGPLSRALAVFGSQSGTQISYEASVAAGKTSPGINAAATREQAVAQILRGSGLTYSFSDPTSVVITDRVAGADDGIDADGSLLLDTINVQGGGNPADIPYETPGSSAYISTTQIERVPAITAGDVFRGVPGLDIRGNHNGTGVDISIRGMSGHNRVNVMVEGTQQQSSSRQGYTGPDNQTHIDQDLISSVSVEKGPRIGPYNAGAIGGVVNVETIQADEILLPGKDLGIRLRGGALGNVTSSAPAVGTNVFDYDRPSLFDANGLSGSIAGAFRNEYVELVAAYSKRKRGNYFAGKHGETHYGKKVKETYSPYEPGAEVFNTSEDTDSLLLKGTIDIGDGHSLEAGYLKTTSEYGWVYPINLTISHPAQDELENLTSDRYWARYKWDPAENDLIKFQSNIWGTTFEKEYYVADTHNWGLEVWNESRAALSLGELVANYGLSYAQENVVQDNNFANNKGQREIGTAFINSKLDILDKLSLTAGVQYTTFSSNSNFINDYGSAEHVEQQGSALSPSASVTYKPLPGVQIFASYAEGYRPPSIREVAPLGGYESDPNLRPEKSTNWEFGGNILTDNVIFSGDSLKLKASYFMNEYEDYIVTQGIPFFGPYYQNIPGAKINGIDISASYKNSYIFLEASLNYYTKFEYCFGDGLIPNAQAHYKGCTEYLTGGSMVSSAISPPKYSGTVTVGTNLFDDSLTIGTSARFFGKAAGSWTQPNGSFLFINNFWRPDVIVDVFGSYKFSDSVRADVSVENVFDRFYVDPMLIAKNPSPGRTFRASLTAKF